MSGHSFIVSNHPLTEIDLTGAKRMKYGDYKRIRKEKKTDPFLDLLDDKEDEQDILIIDSIKMHHLKITDCTNPPYGLEEYIQKDHLYWLEGDSDDEIWKEQLYEYLKGLYD